MSALALPIFSHLEVHTTKAVSRVEGSSLRHSERYRRFAAVVCLPLVWPLRSIADNLKEVISFFNSERADSLSDTQARNVAHRMQQVHGRLGRLLKITDELGLTNLPVYAQLLHSIEERRDHLRSIAEGLYMSLDSEFRKAITDAARELKESAHDGERSGQGSLIGQM